jgi:hypothetical protein
MYLIGCTSNFCWPHQELSQAPRCRAGMYTSNARWIGGSRLAGVRHRLVPAPLVEPRSRGPPRTRLLPDPTRPKQPHGRPRVRPLPDPSVPKRPRGRPRIRPLPVVSVLKRPCGRPRKAALAPTASQGGSTVATRRIYARRTDCWRTRLRKCAVESTATTPVGRDVRSAMEKDQPA